MRDDNKISIRCVNVRVRVSPYRVFWKRRNIIVNIRYSGLNVDTI